MTASQQHIGPSTPMGANLVADGATFRVWAPGALRVSVSLPEGPFDVDDEEVDLLRHAPSGHWTGFVPGVVDGTRYRFRVSGPANTELKRDPWARELELEPWLPDCDCIVRAVDTYPWHDAGFQPPATSELVVYQFHVGVFFAEDDAGQDIRPYRVAKLLDALGRVEYLADLGVTAVQPLPLVEFHGEWSLGYNGTDLFSPETDYCVSPAELPGYLPRINRLLAGKGCEPLEVEQLTGQVNQMKAFVDVCHLYGLAVIADVVYNHAGGDLDPHSLDYFDMPAHPSSDNSIYFSADGWAGGKVFAFSRPEVRGFLIGNATMFLDEYHVDGLRFDEVSVIDAKGGWFFAQDLTRTLRYHRPAAALIAEYWGEQRWRAVAPPPDGMGFDIAYSDALRDGVRQVLGQAAAGADAAVDLDRLVDALRGPDERLSGWRSYHCLENHDLVLDADGDHKHPRVARIADAGNPRSWYARSRSRVAMGLLLTAPGTPMIFMGQEFLEDKLWSDNPWRSDLFLWWDGLAGADRHMADFHAFTRDLTALRRRHPALRSDAVHVYPVDRTNRVVAFQRWVPGLGQDVVVVATFSETTLHPDGYRLGFPLPGLWHEVFNSDVYDHLPNPWVSGNGGAVVADGPPRHGLPHSATVVIPANSLLVFSRTR